MTSPPALSSLRADALRIGLVSMALLTFEITLIRIFSALIFYHLAFFVMAIALFGIGLGGLYAHLLRSRLIRNGVPSPFLAYVPHLIGISMALVPLVLLVLPFGVGSEMHQLPRIRFMAITFCVTAIPFFWGSLYIATLIAVRPVKVTTLYFSDLIGASIGCILAMGVLYYFGGPTAPFIIACVAAFSGVSTRKREWASASALVALFLALALYNLFTDSLTPRNVKEATAEFERWNSFNKISVTEAAFYTGWRLSDRYDGPIPEHRVIWQDGRAPAFIVKFDGDAEAVRYLRYDITSIPWRVALPESALVVGAGGGRDLLTGKLYGSPRIQGVELNTIIANDVMRETYKEFSGNIYGAEGVDVAVENGRTYLARETETYDLIFTSLADTQAANTKGAFVLSENHLYTQEAFQIYVRRLKPGGIYANVGMAYDRLTPIVKRMITTQVTALEAEGIEDIAHHLMVILTPLRGSQFGAYGHVTMISPTPISGEFIERAQQTCEELDFILAWPPQPDQSHEITRHIRQLLDPQDRRTLFATAETDLTPLRDNRPYFFYVLRPAEFFHLLINPQSTRYDVIDDWNRAFFITSDIFFIAFAFVVLLMLGPLLAFRRSDLKPGQKGQIPFLVFFFLLGVAFILVELAFLQDLFLLLGNPILTFAVVLGVMLFFTGLGSFFSQAIPENALPQWVRRIVIATVIIQLTVLLSMPLVMTAFQGAGMPVKFAVVVVILMIMATPMGMLLPSGIRLVNRSNLDMICWVWGMNGVGSVLGSVGSSLIAINFGLSMTFLAGVLAYSLVLFTLPAITRAANYA